MGMFNMVKYSANCLSCKSALILFQTKEGKGVFEIMKPEEAKHFYSICDNCETMNDFYHTKKDIKSWIGSMNCDCGFGNTRTMLGDIDVENSTDDKICVVSGDKSKLVSSIVLECSYCGQKTKMKKI